MRSCNRKKCLVTNITLLTCNWSDLTILSNGSYTLHHSSSWWAGRPAHQLFHSSHEITSPRMRWCVWPITCCRFWKNANVVLFQDSILIPMCNVSTDFRFCTSPQYNVDFLPQQRFSIRPRFLNTIYLQFWDRLSPMFLIALPRSGGFTWRSSVTLVGWPSQAAVFAFIKVSLCTWSI